MANKLPQGELGTGTRVFSGARARFIWNNQQIGFAAGINGSEDIQHEEVAVLDNLAVQEYVPVGYRVSFSAQIFRTIALAVGVSSFDKPGSLKEQQIFPRFDQILRLEGVSAMIQDSITGKTIALIKQIKAASYNWSVGARGIVSQNVTFVALRFLDESELTL